MMKSSLSPLSDLSLKARIVATGFQITENEVVLQKARLISVKRIM